MECSRSIEQFKPNKILKTTTQTKIKTKTTRKFRLWWTIRKDEKHTKIKWRENTYLLKNQALIPNDGVESIFELVPSRIETWLVEANGWNGQGGLQLSYGFLEGAW